MRAFFHALRVASACLRARLASRLASFTRLRARLSSSLAIRTRCRATSACSRARSSGSAGSAAEGVLGGSVRLPLAPDGTAPADRFFLAVFPMQKAAWWQRAEQCHTMAALLATVILSTDFVNNPVQRAACRGKAVAAARACVSVGND